MKNKTAHTVIKAHTEKMYTQTGSGFAGIFLLCGEAVTGVTDNAPFEGGEE